MADELDARLIGKREINLIARLYLLQIFLENVQITLYRLVVLNLHERSLHVAKLPKLAVICETVPAIGARKGKAVVNLPLATAAVEMPIWQAACRCR